MRRMPHVVVGEKNLRVSEKALDRYVQDRTERPWVTGSTKRNQAARGTAFSTTHREGGTNAAPSAETGEPRETNARSARREPSTATSQSVATSCAYWVNTST